MDATGSQVTARSRGGCANCRRRRRKCDETRPSCRACENRHIQCDGYNTAIRWANGIASRGRFAGAAAPNLTALSNSSNSSSISKSMAPIPFYSTTTDNQQPQLDSWSSSSQGTSEDSPGIVSPASDPPRVIRTSTQQLLFNRFIHEGMERLFVVEGDNVPAALFSAMGGQSQAFFVVCVAIQAYFDDGDAVSAMEHCENALQTFRLELQQRHQIFDVSTFSAGLLLCSLCLLQGRAWTMFLERMHVLYRLETNLSHLLPEAGHDPAIEHAIEVFSIMDIESMVIGRVSPSMNSWHQFRQMQESWIGGKTRGVEVVSGISRTLLDIIADVGRRDPQDVESRLWAWHGDIGPNIHCILWDCWRYTAVLDVRRIERNRRKKQAALNIVQRDPEPGTTSSFPTREIIMCRLSAAIYALYQLVGKPGSKKLPIRHGLLYPLVIGSLEVPLLNVHPDWKSSFKEIREEFLEKCPVRCIRLVDEFLEEAWREGTDTFDIEEAARTRGVEIAIY